VTSLPDLIVSAAYAAGSPAASDKVSAAQVDVDHRAIATWINDRLLPTLAEVIRDDDTLVDGIVRHRNLHQEILASLAGLTFLEACAVATTAPILLTGLQTIDGYLTVAGDRVLVTAQASSVANGIYVAAVGGWVRSSDADDTLAVTDAVTVTRGTSYGGTWWRLTAAATIGSDDVGFLRIFTNRLPGDRVEAGTMPVASLAALTARTVIANDTASAAVPTATSIDALTILATGSSTRRSLAARFSQTINVKDHGAVGDGLTNNIAAFIAAAALVTDGTTIEIPDGDYVFDFSTYTVSSPTYPIQGILGLTNKTGVRIRGSGAKLRITNLNCQTKGGWGIIVLNGCSDILIEGLRFDLRGVTGLSVAAPEPSYPIVSAINAIGTTWRDLTVRGCEFTSHNPLGADAASAGVNFIYKQIPVYVSGDSSADVVRGFRFVENTIRDCNTYKVFLLGVGGVEIRGNRFLDIAGLYPCVRNLIHASRAHVIAGNHFEGLKPADEVPANNVRCTDMPQMVLIANATNKGGGGAVVVGNTFALTGSGGINIADCTGAVVAGNTFCDRVAMAAVLPVENDIVACVRLHDEAAGAGSYPATNVAVHDNHAHGTIGRKFIQIGHALNGSIRGNTCQSAAGYGIKASRARNFEISENNVAGVIALAGNQVGILYDSAVAKLAAGEFVRVANNAIRAFAGGTGNALVTISFDATKSFTYGNRVSGVATERANGDRDQMRTDALTFRNDANALSANANDLDWYEEGTWTPVVSFATPGNLAVAYSMRIGKFERIGRQVTVRFALNLAAGFTHTTASGDLQISGLPYANGTLDDASAGAGPFQGITKAGYSHFALWLSSGASVINLYGCNTGITFSTVKAADMPSGGSPFISGTLTYHV